MCYHNHEENIEKAKNWVDYLTKHAKYPINQSSFDAGEIRDLLQSMIEDAETGHAKIKELREILSAYNRN